MRSSFSITVVWMGAFAASATASRQQGARMDGSVEFRFAQANNARGAIRMERPAGAGPLFVDREVVAPASEIERVSIKQQRTRTIFRVVLSAEANARLGKESPGRRGDFLVLLVEGQLVKAWPVQFKVGGTLTRSMVLDVETADLPAGSIDRVSKRYPKT